MNCMHWCSYIFLDYLDKSCATLAGYTTQHFCASHGGLSEHHYRLQGRLENIQHVFTLALLQLGVSTLINLEAIRLHVEY